MLRQLDQPLPALPTHTTTSSSSSRIRQALPSSSSSSHPHHQHHRSVVVMNPPQQHQQHQQRHHPVSASSRRESLHSASSATSENPIPPLQALGRSPSPPASAGSARHNNSSKSPPPALIGRRRTRTDRGVTVVENEQQSVAAETRAFARKQLQAFRSTEEQRNSAYRNLRSCLRNMEQVIADVPVAEQIAADVREKAPSEETVHLKLSNTALHRKVLELTDLLENCLKSEASMRRRLELAEARADSAENKIIDLQSKLFEAELQNLGSPQRLGRAALGGLRR